MDYINPNYFELITPLTKWKILNLERLIKRSYFKPGQESLYKIIKNLEKKGIIESFIDPLSKLKHVYLTDKGASLMGLSSKQSIKRDSRYHDALMSKILEKFQEDFHVTDPSLDFEIVENLSSFDHTPDAKVILNGQTKRQSTLAFELEINQKSKTRIMNTFQYFFKSSHFDKVLFIFTRPTPFETYKKVLGTYSKKEQAKVLLLLEPRLNLQYATLKNGTLFTHDNHDKVTDHFPMKIPDDVQ